MPKDLHAYMWHPSDFRADTRHLNREQSAAYREILDEIFLSGQHESPPSIPDDDEWLMRITQAKSAKEWAQTRWVLIDGPRAVCQRIDGRISQKRLTAEINRALAISQVRRESINRRWKKPAPNASGSTNDLPAGLAHLSAIIGGGNGNGDHSRLPAAAPATYSAMSDDQFDFYALKVGQWTAENGNKGPKSPQSQADFEISVGISWIRWQKEQLFHDRNPKN